ncbi:MAG: hypothetical protein ABSG13_28445 [Bryobacteraceae bacterium]|jgi:hypothetical protein
MDETIDPSSSWVRARAECSVVAVFNRLRLQAQEDVHQRKALRTTAECERFNFNLVSNGNAFTVGRIEQNSHKSITFTTTDRGVRVIDENDKSVLEGILTLGDDGQCRLKTSGRDLEFWQFRRAALEELFF